ncbi:MAG: dodecin domain-containing protein [Actinomycetota bacterium]|nr:dodecin domain-containing protein [Actinomycetota bacterium]
MYESVGLAGMSDRSREDSAATAVAAAGNSNRDLRIAQVINLDLPIADDGSGEVCRSNVKLSSQYEGDLESAGHSNTTSAASAV